MEYKNGPHMTDQTYYPTRTAGRVKLIMLCLGRGWKEDLRWINKEQGVGWRKETPIIRLLASNQYTTVPDHHSPS